MVGLADDWEGQRQTCVDVLCAYLRIPYDPGHTDAESSSAHGQVRHTVIRVISGHLRPDDRRSRSMQDWRGLDLDFSGAVLDDGDFRGAEFSSGKVDFRSATFSGGVVDFSAVEVSSGEVDSAPPCSPAARPTSAMRCSPVAWLTSEAPRSAAARSTSTTPTGQFRPDSLMGMLGRRGCSHLKDYGLKGRADDHLHA
jgi:hypothetical protein